MANYKTLKKNMYWEWNYKHYETIRKPMLYEWITHFKLYKLGKLKKMMMYEMQEVKVLKEIGASHDTNAHMLSQWRQQVPVLWFP